MMYPSELERASFRRMALGLLAMGELDWTPPIVLAFRAWLDDLARWDRGPPPPPPFA